MVVAAVVLELVLASELVAAKGAGEGLGRVLGVDVSLEGRVLVEVRAALALVGLVGGLLCVIVKSEGGLERREAGGAIPEPAGKRATISQGVKKKKHSPIGSRTLGGCEIQMSMQLCRCATLHQPR